MPGNEYDGDWDSEDPLGSSQDIFYPVSSYLQGQPPLNGSNVRSYRFSGSQLQQPSFGPSAMAANRHGQHGQFQETVESGGYVYRHHAANPSSNSCDRTVTPTSVGYPIQPNGGGGNVVSANKSSLKQTRTSTNKYSQSLDQSSVHHGSTPRLHKQSTRFQSTPTPPEVKSVARGGSGSRYMISSSSSRVPLYHYDDCALVSGGSANRPPPPYPHYHSNSSLQRALRSSSSSKSPKSQSTRFNLDSSTKYGGSGGGGGGGIVRPSSCNSTRKTMHSTSCTNLNDCTSSNSIVNNGYGNGHSHSSATCRSNTPNRLVTVKQQPQQKIDNSK